MGHIGIDVHKTQSQVCILNESGERIEQRILTDRVRFGEVFGGRPGARILIEASTESEWVARCLEQLGHEGIVADPNFAPMYATRSRRVKTDRRDARALAEACQLGAYRPAHRTSETQRLVRAHLTVREALVRTRSRYISVVRSLLRREGLRVRGGEAKSFGRRVGELEVPRALALAIEPSGGPTVSLLKFDTPDDNVEHAQATFRFFGEPTANFNRACFVSFVSRTAEAGGVDE